MMNVKEMEKEGGRWKIRFGKGAIFFAIIG